MPPPRPHLILFGGFLGAGKTTAMIAFAGWLADQGIRAAFITNDQGSELVDTRLLKYCGAMTDEITGGCFCCRFDELVGATERLRSVWRPDVFVAEAVGSCTDLVATVSFPLRRLLADSLTVAPLSVLVDPIHAQRALGLTAGEPFSPNVEYIHDRQLAEADVIVITKSDTLAIGEAAEIRAALERRYPHATVRSVSAANGDGLDAWFRQIVFDEQVPRPPIDVDYDRYADGEAALGWLNARARASASAPADGDALLLEVADALRQRLAASGIAIAHLKMTLEVGGELGAVSVVRGEMVPELRRRLPAPIAAGTLTVNLRAEGAPGQLEAEVRRALGAADGWTITVEALEAFRPSRPVPTHRDTIMPADN